MRRDPERIYQAQRAGFVEGLASRHEAGRKRIQVVLDALEMECGTLGLERGSPEFWREAERRAVGRWLSVGVGAQLPKPGEFGVVNRHARSS